MLEAWPRWIPRWARSAEAAAAASGAVANGSAITAGFALDDRATFADSLDMRSLPGLYRLLAAASSKPDSDPGA